MSSNKSDLFQAVLFAVATGGGLIWSALKNHKKARKIQDTARSKVASAPQGLVELEGFAWPAFETKRNQEAFEAVYYHLQLQREETRGSGKNRRKEWVTVFSFYHEHPFYLVDGSGLALVDPANSDLSTDGDRTTLWTKIKPEEQQRLCNEVITDAVSNFPPSKGFLGLFSNKYRIVEKEILVGSPLYVQGHFTTEGGESTKVKVPALAQFFPRVFDVTTGKIKNLSHLMDKNRDQKLSANETKQGYTMLGKTALSYFKINKAEIEEFPLCGSVATSTSHKLLIADAHEAQLVTRLQKWFWLRFAGGAALVTVGIGLALDPSGSQLQTIVNVPKKPSRQVAAAPAAATSSQVQVHDPKPYHELCVRGNKDACEELVNKSSVYKLNAEYISYYKKRLSEIP